MSKIVDQAIATAEKSDKAFCKFISANDAGSTGAHQSGYYIPKNAVSLLFDTPGIKGQNKEKFVTIRWQNEFETSSRFIYYGVGTRNEYRITRFGRGFPFLSEDNVGDLLILCHIEGDHYEGYVLTSDEDTEAFLAALNIDINETNKLISKDNTASVEDRLLKCFLMFVQSLGKQFPPTVLMASTARQCYNTSFGITASTVRGNPDKNLLYWLEAEFELFKTIENEVYSDQIKEPFKNVEQLVIFANTILNRRKSRAGKSLEYHLEEVFRHFNLRFNTQVITEGNKKPDFIFPDADSYHNKAFDDNKLVFLASKTTCKDRWRQIINEADRIPTKHLFTLQQGISKNQLEEMYAHDICLVVPKPYLTSFPVEYRSKIQTLESFVNYTITTQTYK
ncbi:type II restriction endonuclease [Daejeonella sp.]|uniref:type II restriction endonuclease n=1 Tax=Daejeonella sp. TaxID=2805397 RepID=UPI002731F001|nr:type II restriction endonuclease [Daejeonella sp.]MDP2414292.1 type II restriction endonuclease [Daejeonella sp.]